MKLLEYLNENYTRQEQKELICLYCSYEGISSLEGIENCTNLKELYCYDNALINLKGIENLTKLEELYCHNNALTSLKGIESLTNLTHLYCHNNDIKEIDLSYNKELRYVYMDKSTKLLNVKNYNINELIIV